MSDARRHTFFVLFSVALVFFAFTPIRRLATLSLNLGNNQLSYIPLVPFVSAALIYWNRKKIFSKLRTSALGGHSFHECRAYAARSVPAVSVLIRAAVRGEKTSIVESRHEKTSFLNCPYSNA